MVIREWGTTERRQTVVDIKKWVPQGKSVGKAFRPAGQFHQIDYSVGCVDRDNAYNRDRGAYTLASCELFGWKFCLEKSWKRGGEKFVVRHLHSVQFVNY